MNIEEMMNHLMSGTAENPVMIALEMDEDEDEVLWGLIYDGENIVSDSGQCYPDIISEDEAKKLIEKYCI